MLNTFRIRIFKNISRLSLRGLNNTDSRLLYLHLKDFINEYELKYMHKLSGQSILINHDGKEIFKSKETLLKFELRTIEDILDYLGIENIKYMIVDNEEIKDLNTQLSNIYVLELYSSWSYLTREQIEKMGKR